MIREENDFAEPISGKTNPTFNSTSDNKINGPSKNPLFLCDVDSNLICPYEMRFLRNSLKTN